jgi:hypothetical protein
MIASKRKTTIASAVMPSRASAAVTNALKSNAANNGKMMRYRGLRLYMTSAPCARLCVAGAWQHLQQLLS